MAKQEMELLVAQSELLEKQKELMLAFGEVIKSISDVQVSQQKQIELLNKKLSQIKTSIDETKSVVFK